jgi:hypothetical protein
MVAKKKRRLAMKFHSGSVMVKILVVVALVLLPWINVANASDIKVNLSVPTSVAPCASFNIGIQVTNNTPATIYFNKVAVAYALQDLKVRGPYEVDSSEHQVASKATLNFTVPFKILFSTGVVVPITVVLANNSYTQTNVINNVVTGIIGGSIAGVKVN